MKQLMPALLLLLSNVICSAQTVTTSGNSILVDGQRYTIRGVCYSPRSIGANWFDYPDLGYPSYEAFAQDIEMMNAACINTIRTYYAIFDQTRLDQLANAGIKVIITFPYQDMRSNVNTADRYEMLNGTYQSYINRFKNHPAILMWSFGNEMNYFIDDNVWYPALESAAAWTHVNDPNHPVTTANGEVPTTEMMENLSPSVDVWGANIYRFGVANTPLGDYYERGGRKPFWYSEIGVDSYNHNINRVDEDIQATATENMWADIQYSIDNNGICSGATYFNWTDEWWKSGTPNTQNTGGAAPSGAFYPDQITDEEYYGILNQDRTPKKAYFALQNIWASTCAQASPASFVLEDAECNRHLGYTNFDGAFEIVDNPAPSGINNSAKCIRYQRASVQFAAIIGNTPQLTGAADFPNNILAPTLDVYTSEANITVTLNLESSNDLAEPYPTGRFAVYTAVTTKTNEWETLKFVLQDPRDGNVNPNSVDRVAILFNAGNTNDNGIYYFDNLKGPEVVGFNDMEITSINTPTPSSSCIADENTIAITIKNNGPNSVNFANSNVNVYANVTGQNEQTFITGIPSGTLAVGASIEVTITDQADFTSSGTYQIEAGVHAPGDNVCNNNLITGFELVSEVCVGLNNPLASDKIQMYPNPTSDVLTIRISDQDIQSVDILNLQGAIIKSVNIKGQNELNLSFEEFANGFYFLRMNNDQQNFIERIQVLK